MYLIDTNIFLEGFLEQEKSVSAKSFLEKITTDQVYISDFSLFSIGIILFKLKRKSLFLKLLNDLTVNSLKILSLDKPVLIEMEALSEKYNLDFDDSYQYLIAKTYQLQIVSFDKDFDKTDIKRIEPL